MSEDLAAFLLARITEDEIAARAAALAIGEPSTLRWAYDGAYGVLVYRPAGRSGGSRCTEHAPDVPNLCDDTEVLEIADAPRLPAPIAEHVIRWDPARVLPDCDARLRLVHEHEPDAPYCGWSHGNSDSHADAGDTACETLRILALPYATHPDYRSEWAP